MGHARCMSLSCYMQRLTGKHQFVSRNVLRVSSKRLVERATGPVTHLLPCETVVAHNVL